MKKYGEPAGTRTGKRQVKRRSLGGRTAENTAKPARPAKYAPGGAVRRVGDGIRELGGKCAAWVRGMRAPKKRNAQDVNEVRALKKGAWKQILRREGKFYGGVTAAAAAVILLAAVLCSGVLLPREYDILLNDAGRLVAASTTETTVGAFLEKNGVTLGEGDVLAMDESAPIKDGLEIVIKRAFAVNITKGDEKKSIRMLAGTVQQALDAAGITLGEHDEVYPVADTMISSGGEITIVEVEQKTITEDEVLFYKEVTKNDATLAKGKTKVSQAGENGLERHTIEVVYKNGVEVSRKTVKSEVVRKPVDQVTRIGTYEAPKATEKPKDDNKNPNKGDSKPAGSTDWGSVNAEGKLVSVPTISQIHTGNLYEHKKAPEPDASIIAKTVYIDHVTAYTWTGSPTATGVYPKMGTIAADPAKFPYGTKVYVPGYGYGRIEDTGGFRGKEHTQFDLYMDSEADCRTWGRKRNYKVYILK